jgi:hypothetical protein
MALNLQRVQVRYPEHQIDKPGDILDFLRTPLFKRCWEKNLRLTDDDLNTLCVGITCMPHLGKVIPRSGGIRKFRIAREGASKGKSGGARVLYCVIDDSNIALLLYAYQKSGREQVSAAGLNALKSNVDVVRDFFHRGGTIY